MQKSWTKYPFKQTGFSLIELAAVITILGLLVKTVLPSLVSQIQQSEISTMLVLAEPAKRAVYDDYIRNGGNFVAFNPVDQNISSSTVASVKINYVNNMNIVNIYSTSDANAVVPNTQVILALVPTISGTNGGTLTWVCKNNNNAQYVNLACQTVCTIECT